VRGQSWGRWRRHPIRTPAKVVLGACVAFAVSLVLPWWSASISGFGVTLRLHVFDLWQGKAATAAMAATLVLLVRHLVAVRQTLDQIKATTAAGTIGAIFTVWYWAKVPSPRHTGPIDAGPSLGLYLALAASITAAIASYSLQREVS
jgi:hypothetical protein